MAPWFHQQWRARGARHLIRCFISTACIILVWPLVALAAESPDTDTPPAEPPAVASTPVPDVVYVATPHDVVAKMLDTAGLTKDDVIYDLGCGDGRIVATAARAYGCRGFGFDISPKRVVESRNNCRKYGVEHLVTIKEQNIFKLDLSPANVVTLYLLPSMNVRLIPQLEKLRPGSRIVAHDFDMKGVEPDKVIHMNSREDGVEHTVYLWTVPLNKSE
jgi:SAM-dependent methyltransferase